MKKGLLGVSIFLLLFLLSSCATIEEPPFPANLLGVIYDNYNNPVSGASITMEDGRALSSDIDGRFVLPALNKQEYKIIVSKKGFEPVDVELDFFDPKQVLYIKLSSITYFKEEIEKSLKSKDWEKADRMITRAFKIDEKDPVLLYLAAIYSLEVDKYNQCLGYLNSLGEIGYSTAAIGKLEDEVEKKRSEE